MKTRKLIILSTVLGTLFLAGCLKKGSMNIDPYSTEGSIITLAYLEGGSGSTINSGMQYFGGANLTYPGSDEVDTATYNVNLAGPATLGSDLNVTVGYDESKLNDNFANDAINYELMPDSVYDFVQTSAVIKAGTRTVPLQIAFYPSKIDPTKSYMLPVTIKEAGGKTISSNFGTIYYHVIGNPLAGAYKWTYLRFNKGDTTGSATTSWFDEPTTFLPVNPTTVQVNSGYGDQNGLDIRYQMTFTNTGGVLSDFKVKINPTDVTESVYGAIGAKGFTDATIVVADLVNRHFRFTYQVVNSAGAARTLIDDYSF